MSTTPTVHFEAASTLAVVVSSHEPLLFLSDDLKIIAASASFCRAFDIDPRQFPAKSSANSDRGNGRCPSLSHS